MSYKIVAKQPSILWSDINEINDRIDAKYYHCDYMVFNIKNYGEFEIKSLKQCVNFFETGVSNFNDGNIKLKRLKTSNIQNGFILYQDLTDCVVPERDKKKILCKGDVVLTTYGTGSIGKVAYVNFDTQIIPDYTIAILRTKKTIDSGYLASFLGSIYGKQQIMRRVIGTSGITLVIKPHLIDIQIPIPSPEIQKYIGDKVRRAEELREEAKKLKKEAEGIIYKELNFGSLEDKLKIINNKYTWVGLHNLGIRIDSKYYNEKVLRIKDYFNKHYETIKLKECLQYCSRGKSFAESSEDGIILIKTKNLNNSFINYERNFVYEKEVNNNLILKEKDLIFASMGVGSLGKIDMYYPSEEKATIDGTLMLLRFKSDSKLKPEYVMEFLRTHIGQKLIYQNVVGSTGIISISVDDLINIDIPYIDDEKQEKISNFTNKYLTDIYASKRLIQEAKQDVEDLIEGNFDMSKIKAHS